jgi:hypothetical protein
MGVDGDSPSPEVGLGWGTYIWIGGIKGGMD